MTDTIASIGINLSAKGAEKVVGQLHSIKASGKTAAIALTGIANQLARMERNGLAGVQRQMNQTTSAGLTCTHYFISRYYQLLRPT